MSIQHLQLFSLHIEESPLVMPHIELCIPSAGLYELSAYYSALTVTGLYDSSNIWGYYIAEGKFGTSVQ